VLGPGGWQLWTRRGLPNYEPRPVSAPWPRHIEPLADAGEVVRRDAVPLGDYGPNFRYSDESGLMTKVVPPIKQIIPTPAAKVDEDGNEIAGVRSVLLQAPLGTYTSWNPVASGPLKGNEGNLAAGYIPFAMPRPRGWPAAIRVGRSRSATAARRGTTA